MTEDVVAVSRTVKLAAPVAEVWGLVGNFHRLHEWHPAVESSTPERAADAEFRHLSLAGGGEITEQLLDRTTHSYSYRIVKSPLPVAHYEARIEAWAVDGGTELKWSSSFTPKAENAEEVVAGIYESGFGALAERFGALD